MSVSGLGYGRDLFILPFDHRGSFEAGLLGIRDGLATPKEAEQLAAYKRVIYEGFLRAVGEGMPQETAAILVDQKYGEELLSEARGTGFTTCVSVEKSGQAEFDFEYGENFKNRLHDAYPTFAKVLVRYNPEGDARANQRQARRLNVLSSYLHSVGIKFMFELLVPATEDQLAAPGQDKTAYDLDTRPPLTVRAIKELQGLGIEPDVWKLEGTDTTEASCAVVEQVRSNGRSGVGAIVLGRGEDEDRVLHWLSIGAQTPGVIGFAVGRTVFWQPLVELKEGAISRNDAVERIAGTYQKLHRHFISSRPSR